MYCQDFYAHSNWVELGYTDPYINLIRPDHQLENLAGVCDFVAINDQPCSFILCLMPPNVVGIRDVGQLCIYCGLGQNPSGFIAVHQRAESVVKAMATEGDSFWLTGGSALLLNSLYWLCVPFAFCLCRCHHCHLQWLCQWVMPQSHPLWHPEEEETHIRLHRNLLLLQASRYQQQTYYQTTFKHIFTDTRSRTGWEAEWYHWSITLFPFSLRTKGTSTARKICKHLYETTITWIQSHHDQKKADKTRHFIHSLT